MRLYSAETGLHTAGKKMDAEKNRIEDFGRGISGLDFPGGLARFRDGKSFLRILGSYAVNTKPLLESIRTVDRGNLAGYATIVHGIKGSSRNICAEALGDQAEALEHAARAGDVDFVAKSNPAFLEAAGRLIGEIEAMLAAIAKASPKPKKNAPDAGVLLRLLDSCANFDLDEVETAMDEIERYEYESDGGLVASLRESVTRMDFDAVAGKLAFLRAEGGGEFG